MSLASTKTSFVRGKLEMHNIINWEHQIELTGSEA